MTRQMVLRPVASTVDRRLPLLDNSDEYSSRGSVSTVRLAEVAGGTTAECAAVCCCCPCALVNLLVLVACKLPAGLCRKALRSNRRRKMVKMGVLPPRTRGWDHEQQIQIHPVTGPIAIVESDSGPENKEVMELDKEMLEQFYSGGFWRSSSRRSEI